MTEDDKNDQINDQHDANKIAEDEDENISMGEAAIKETLSETENATSIIDRDSSWDNAIVSGIISGIIVSLVAIILEMES